MAEGASPAVSAERPSLAALTTPTAIVESFIAAWNANDLEKILAHLHPQVVYHNVPLAPIHGRDAVRAYLADKVPFEWVDWKLLAIAAVGNKVLTERSDDFGVGGVTVRLPLMGIFEIEDGLIAAWRDYFDLAMYRQQLKPSV